MKYLQDPTRHLALPKGVHDLDPETATAFRSLSEAWLRHVQLFGYREVRVPPLGFADTFTVGHHAAHDRLYLFNDKKGRPLALAGDSLSQIPRICSTRLEVENRLSFCAPVFRYKRQRRRFWHLLGATQVVQNGIESAEELLHMAVEFLCRRVDIRLVVNDVGLWREVLNTSGIGDTLEGLNALRQSVPARWGALLADLEVQRDTCTWVERAVVGQWWELPPPPGAAARLQRLEALADKMRAAYPRCHVHIDLTNLHACEFHSGLAFEILSLDGAVRYGDGGSYDAFGKLFLNRENVRVHSVVVVPERLIEAQPTESTSPADISGLSGPCPTTAERARQLAQRLRQRGIAVWLHAPGIDIAGAQRLNKKLAIQWLLLPHELDQALDAVTLVRHNGRKEHLCLDDLDAVLNLKRPPSQTP